VATGCAFDAEQSILILRLADRPGLINRLKGLAMSIDRTGMVADLYEMAARAKSAMMIDSRGVQTLKQLIHYRDLNRHYEACMAFAAELVAH
jgi:hypothetical protein